MYQSLSLSLSPFTFAKNGLDPGIQERMFRQVKKLFMCNRKTQSVVQKPMHTIKWVLSVYIVRPHARIQKGGIS